MQTKKSVQLWEKQIGSQRDWVWRGWKIRYTYLRTPATNTPLTNIPLIFIHGFGSGIGQWCENLNPISQQYPIYALDLLGFGASEKASTEYNVNLWAAQIHEFWRLVIGQPVVIIGHSLGALVALATAAAYPEMTKGLVLLTLPSARKDLLPAYLDPLVGNIEGLFASPLLLGPLFKFVLSRRSIIASFAKFAYFNPEALTPDMVSVFFLPIQDRNADRALYSLTRSRSHPNFCPSVKELLPTLQIPILTIWGKEDRLIPLSWGRKIANLNPNLRMIELDKAGHCAYHEYPDIVNQQILTWLQDI